jgi:dienelactone hydrolase
MWLVATVGALLGACAYAPAPATPRAPLPAEALGLRIADVEPPELRDFVADAPGRCRGTLASGGETVAFELRHAPDDPGRPIVLLVPILGGGAEILDLVAARLQQHGFDVAWCARAGSALKPGQRGADLEQLFRRTVLHQRVLLRWLRERHAAPSPQFALGMSLGGMVATALAAHEPELDGVAVCLSGGDIAGIIGCSDEPRVQEWRRWRREADGLDDAELHAELCHCLAHEPLRFAPAVATERVLLVAATLDDVVPPRHQDLLWEAFGRPARLSLPLGHYTAALAADAIVAAAARHFRGRMP